MYKLVICLMITTQLHAMNDSRTLVPLTEVVASQELTANNPEFLRIRALQSMAQDIKEIKESFKALNDIAQVAHNQQSNVCYLYCKMIPLCAIAVSAVIFVANHSS